MRAERGLGQTCRTCPSLVKELGLYPKGNGKFTEMLEAGKPHHQICVFRKVTLAMGRKMMEAESSDRG